MCVILRHSERSTQRRSVKRDMLYVPCISSQLVLNSYFLDAHHPVVHLPYAPWNITFTLRRNSITAISRSRYKRVPALVSFWHFSFSLSFFPSRRLVVKSAIHQPSLPVSFEESYFPRASSIPAAIFLRTYNSCRNRHNFDAVYGRVFKEGNKLGYLLPICFCNHGSQNNCIAERRDIFFYI